MDNKVIIYGLYDPGSSGVFQQKAFQFDTYGFLPIDLQLGGTTIFSQTPFSPITVGQGNFDYLPCVSPCYMVGQNAADTDPYFGALAFLSQNTATNAGDALITAELMDNGGSDAPAAATAAQVNFGASGENYIRISGLQVTLNCVANQAAPVDITITENPVDSPTVIFRARLTGAAGTTVVFAPPLNLAAFKGAQIDVSAPAATNFVTLSAQANTSIGGSGLLGGT